MALTTGQELEVWNVVGTWLAGLATFSAVVVSLYLANRKTSVQLKVVVGLRLLIRGDGSPAQEHLVFKVTNLAEHPVIIEGIGWVAGRGKHRIYALQTVSGDWTSHYPSELTHAKSASFMVSFLDTPNWMTDFARDFLAEVSDEGLKTLRAQVFTSVGKTIEVKPEQTLLERLKEARHQANVANDEAL